MLYAPTITVWYSLINLHALLYFYKDNIKKSKSPLCLGTARCTPCCSSPCIRSLSSAGILLSSTAIDPATKFYSQTRFYFPQVVSTEDHHASFTQRRPRRRLRSQSCPSRARARSARAPPRNRARLLLSSRAARSKLMRERRHGAPSAPGVGGRRAHRGIPVWRGKRGGRAMRAGGCGARGAREVQGERRVW